MVKVVYKVLGINAPGIASNSSFNTLQLTRNDHKREKKYRINKRELQNLRKKRMFNKSNRKQAKIQKRKYNYLQDLCGNSEITTTDLQRRNIKLYKNFNQIKNA